MNRRDFQRMAAAILAGSGLTSLARAAGKPRRPKSFTNLHLRTSGGQQLWADVRLFHQLRIQQHAYTGHYRLLDNENVRQAWGTLEACETKLESIRHTESLPPMKETAVVLLHGLFRARGSMSRLAQHLRKQTDWEVLNFGYPSTRGSIADHAGKLAEVIAHLEGVKTIHFVAHSLGNLVIRHWLADVEQGAKVATGINLVAGAKEANPDKKDAQRLGRIAMIGPPNHRPSLAQTLIPIDRHKMIAGQAGQELQSDWTDLVKRLATPPCDFGILAGGLNDGEGYNPLIPGDDDMIVGVDETKLAGAKDFRLLPVIHATMMDDQALQQMVSTFLQKGFFETADSRQPLA